VTHVSGKAGGKPALKVAVIGGGSTYTPELVSGLRGQHEDFPMEELWLQDVDAARLEVVGGFARRMVAAQDDPFRLVLSTDRQAALQGADYVITQLRVGQMEARRQDEYLGRRHGLIGQETTGVGGMAKALRTIPILLQVADEMQELARPGALLVNFTNPAGLVTQALSLYAPETPAVGVCNIPITVKMKILARLEQILGRPVGPVEARLDTLGLNHLSWHRGFTLNGENVWPQVLKGYVAELKSQENPEWDPGLVESLQMLPNSYLKYYYHTAEMLQAQESWPPSRAEEVIDIERSLLEQYADPGLNAPPPDMMQRGGAFYSTLAVQLLADHFNDTGGIHIVNVRNSGAVPEWPAGWVLEMPAEVRRSGITPLPAEPLGQAQFELLARVKSFELLTAQAARDGDRKAALQALLAHPLGPGASRAEAVLEDVLAVNRPYLPQFWE
jgi:6-phospho-beta-glucosidase